MPKTRMIRHGCYRILLASTMSTPSGRYGVLHHPAARQSPRTRGYRITTVRDQRLGLVPFRRVWGPRRVTAIRCAPPFVCLLRPGFAPIRPPFNTSEADFPIRPSFLRRNGFRLDSFQQRIDAGHGAPYPLQPSACQRSLRHRSTVILPHRGLSWTHRNSGAACLRVKRNEKFLGHVPVWTTFGQKRPDHDEGGWFCSFFAATALSAQDITPHIISLVL